MYIMYKDMFKIQCMVCGNLKNAKKLFFLITWIVMKISHDLSNGDTNGTPTSKSNKFSQGLR